MATFTGYRMSVELLDDEAVITRIGMAARTTAAEIRVPLDALVEVRYREATPMVNGALQFVLADAPAPPKPAASDPYTVIFRRKTRNEFAQLRQLLEDRTKRNRADGVDASRVPVERVVGKLQGRAGAPTSFADITIANGQIQSPHGGGPIDGARATVDTAGQLSRRITATRLVLTGPLALAWRKKKDERELYLLIEGDGWAVSVQVDARRGAEARDFAAKINALGSSTAHAHSDSGTSAPVASTGPIDPVEQITKLGALREQGLLSDEEFEEKKRDLLRRI
jgi:Short C-terminal domain/Domain of unknown function (DUF4429)